MADDVLDFFTNRSYDKPNQGTAFKDTLGAVANLYTTGQGIDALAKNNQAMSGQMETLGSMYGSNSPYAQQLRQALARKDAAAGRNSQYGPREVDLQARLAGLQGQNATAMGNLATQQNASAIQQQQLRAQQLAHLFNLADKTGATDWAGSQLKDIFGGGSAVNQPMSASPYAGGGDYSGWSPGQSYEAPQQSGVPISESPYASYGGNYQNYTTGSDYNQQPYNEPSGTDLYDQY